MTTKLTILAFTFGTFTLLKSQKRIDTTWFHKKEWVQSEKRKTALLECEICDPSLLTIYTNNMWGNVFNKHDLPFGTYSIRGNRITFNWLSDRNGIKRDTVKPIIWKILTVNKDSVVFEYLDYNNKTRLLFLKPKLTK